MKTSIKIDYFPQQLKYMDEAPGLPHVEAIIIIGDLEERLIKIVGIVNDWRDDVNRYNDSSLEYLNEITEIVEENEEKSNEFGKE
jgi:hypothetical protein